MHAACIIAMTKQGKSRFVREKIIGGNVGSQLRCLINDINDEYGEFRKDRETGILTPSSNLTSDTNCERSRYCGGDIEEFMSIVKTKRFTNIVFEEATGFFMGATGKDLRKIIIAKGHTNNNYFFLFHSITSVPPMLLTIMDYVLLFKTQDTERQVKSKDPRLLKYWFVLQQKRDGAPPYHINMVNENYNENFYLKLKNSKK